MPSPGLTDQQARAARALGQGYSRADAARVAGCAERTLRHWFQTIPAFREAAQAVQEESDDPDARSVLHALLRSEREDIRLRSAVALLQKPEDSVPVEQPGAIHLHVTRLPDGSIEVSNETPGPETDDGRLDGSDWNDEAAP